MNSHELRFAFGNPVLYAQIRRVMQKRLTYLSRATLIDLCTAIQAVERQQVKGMMLEAGCALGGSAIILALAKQSQRPFSLFDVFDQIPPPSPKDGPDVHERYKEIQSGNAAGINGDDYYGYVTHLEDVVIANMSRFGININTNAIEIVKGLYQDTMHIDQPVAFAHIDCDWYESVLTCLTQIVPHLSIGGCLVIDDYEAWSGCRKAVDEFFALRRDSFRFLMKSRLHIVRVAK